MEELSIRSVLNEQRIDLHLKGQTKDEVLDEMVDLLFKDSVLSSKEQFLKDVYYREGEGITGIGESDSVLHTAVAIGRSDHDLEWRSIDDKPVRLIIMLAIKSVDKTVHMKLLSNVATSLCQRDVIEQIFVSEDKQEIIELFEQKGGKE